MTATFLTEDDVQMVMDVETSIAVIEKAFQALANGTAENVPRHRAKAPGIMLHSMCAAAEYLGVVGWKTYVTTPQGARPHSTQRRVGGGDGTPSQGTGARRNPHDGHASPPAYSVSACGRNTSMLMKAPRTFHDGRSRSPPAGAARCLPHRSARR